MKRLVVLLTLLSVVLPTGIAWAQSLPTAQPEEVGLSSERLERVSRALRGEIEAGKIPGAVALVARKGRVVYYESFGVRDKASGDPMPKDAIFRIYSMTKPFTSVAAMMLMEDGKVLITDPVSRFLPQLAKREVNTQQLDPATGKVSYVVVPAERERTIQDLLRHTSGLVYGSFTPNARIKELYPKDGVTWDKRDARRADPATGQGSARPPARDHSGIQPLYGCAGTCGREGFRDDAQSIPHRPPRGGVDASSP
jgi:CubicO group peptidase (beta-lactamase class C family)